MLIKKQIDFKKQPLYSLSKKITTVGLFSVPKIKT